MKISTLALGALISFSVSTIAQEKPKSETKTKHTKTTKSKTKCAKSKEHMLDEALLIKPRHKSVCEACGRG